MQCTYTLKVITYEEARRDFFLEKKHEAERKLQYWKKKLSKKMQMRTLHIDQKCADLGLEINFYDDALRALGYEAAQPKWISMEDKLPDKDGEYLVYKQHYYNPSDGFRKMCVCTFITDRLWIDAGNLCIVTHWMPLPQAPEVEKDD